MIASVISRSALTRREIAFWIGSVVFGRFVLSIVHAAVVFHTPGEKTVNLFQFFAWFVLFRMLSRSTDPAPARALDIGALALCALCAFFPGDNATWAAITLAAIYFWISRDGDPYRSSAAALLLALAANGFWGPLFFSLLSVWLLDFDAWLTAQVLRAFGALTSHRGNEVSVGNQPLEIFAQCSSFHNISLALLAWVSLTKFVRPQWVRGDIAVAAACVAVTLLWNVIRLTILALDAADKSAFDFWHTGDGAHLIVGMLAFSIAVISVAGAQRARI